MSAGQSPSVAQTHADRDAQSQQPVSEATLAGAAAQTSSATSYTLPAGDEPLVASNAPVDVSGIKDAKIKNKLSKVNEVLAKAQTNAQVQHDAKAGQKVPLALKGIANKTMKKAEKLLTKRENREFSTQKTAASGNNLVLVGLLLVIIGLLLALLTTGSTSTVGLIVLIVGLVLALVGLLS